MPPRFPITLVLSLVCLVVPAWADFHSKQVWMRKTVETSQRPCVGGDRLQGKETRVRSSTLACCRLSAFGRGGPRTKPRPTCCTACRQKTDMAARLYNTMISQNR